MIKVIDNFLSTSYFNKIEEVVTSSQFEWISTNNITDGDCPQLGYMGFCHPICVNNDLIGSHFSFMMSGFLYQVMDLVERKNIIRSRFDMTVYNPNKLMHSPHVDLEEPYTPNITTIFYITDNLDSETIIFDKKFLKKRIKKI